MSGTVGKALTLLEHLSRYDAPVRLAELSRAIDMNKSTTYRLLETLAQMGYVTQDEPNGRYLMTVKMWEIGVRAFQRSDLRLMARPHLAAITSAVNETALLTRVGAEDVIIIEKVDCEHSLQAISPLGSRSPIHASSFGKAYLMQQPDEVIMALGQKLPGFTPQTVTEVDALLAQLAQMRLLGFAIGRDEYLAGISGIAAPVIGTDGKVYATLGVSMPSFRLTPETEPAIVAAVLAAAKSFSAQLGYHEPQHNS